MVGINEFLSVREIATKKEVLEERMPPSVWPIAFAEGGNYVCMDLQTKPGIYFWDHEFEQEEGVAPTWDNLTLLTDTFETFWQRLRTRNRDTQPRKSYQRLD